MDELFFTQVHINVQSWPEWKRRTAGIKRDKLAVRRSTKHDVVELSSRLRPEDIQEVFYYDGSTGLEALIKCFFGSEKCYSIVGEDDIAVAMYGIGASEQTVDDDYIGQVWMLCSEELFQKANFRLIAKHLNKFFEHLVDGYDIVYNYYWIKNESHRKLIKKLGFDFGPIHKRKCEQDFQYFEWRKDKECAD